MKLLQLLIKISLVFSWVFVTADIARSQSGNQSDITGPNSTEFPDTNESANDSDNSQAGNDRPTNDSATDSDDLQAGNDEPITDSDTSQAGNNENDDGSSQSLIDESLSEAENGNVTGSIDEDGNVTGSVETEDNTITGSVDGEDGTATGSVETEDTLSEPLAEDTLSESVVEDTPTESVVEDTPTESVVEDTLTEPVAEDTPTEPVAEDTPTEPVAREESVNDGGDTSNTSESQTESELTEKLKPTATESESESEVVDKTESESAVEETEETVAEEEQPTEEEAVAEEEEEVAEEEQPAEKEAVADLVEVGRSEFEALVQNASPTSAVELGEEFAAHELVKHSGIEIYGQVPSAPEISQRLGQLWRQTGKKPAFINVSLQEDQLESFLVLPTVDKTAQKDTPLVASTNIDPRKIINPKTATLRETVENTSRQDLLATAAQFRQEVSNVKKLQEATYLESAQELYQTLIAPIEQELQANDIDVLVFSMDSGLRLLPIAALHDGEQFLIEKYAVSLVPSFGLTDTRYVNLNQSPILAMGASEFSEQPSLPTMPIELETIVRNPRRGEIFLNEQFTVENFKVQNNRSNPFPIIHLGTHAEFQTENLSDSYIQFYDDKLELSELREISDELGWNSSDASPIELLVLSACQTALGDEEAELGFAGLAVQAGVKSALASLWYISDLGTLALMSEFYNSLGDTLIKAEALRQTQLKMLQGEVKVNDRQVQLSNGQSLNLPAEFPQGSLELSHPYFWSAFTLIGNWN